MSSPVTRIQRGPWSGFLMRLSRFRTWAWQHATIFVCLIGMTLTAVSWLVVMEVSRNALNRSFEQETDHVADAIHTRLGEVRHTLRAAQVLFESSDTVTAEEWRTLCARMEIGESMLGLKGLAYVQRVPAEQLPAFLKRVRQEQPDFQLKALEDRPVHHIIRFIEPTGVNRAALGFDVAGHPRSRAVQEASVRTGRPALSEPMQLVQSPEGVTGFVMYLPVFDLRMPIETVAQRRAALRGWVAASMEIDSVLRHLIGDAGRDLAFRLYDGPATVDKQPFYERAAFDAEADWLTTRQIEVGGRTWTMVCASLPAFGMEMRDRSIVVLAGGVLGTTVIGLIVFSLTNLRARAEALANRMTAQLRRSEKRFRTAFENAAVGMVTLDLNGRFLTVNAAFAKMVGYTIAELRGMSCAALSHPDDAEQDRQRLGDLIEGRVDWITIEKRYQHRSGQPVWVIVTATLIQGEGEEPDYLLTQVQDITERKRMEEELRQAALHDNLTGLPDRSVFEQRLKTLWRERTAAGGSPFAVLFMDLDRFKQVNDEIGHDAGDSLLCQIADRLRQCTRATDLVALRAEAMPARVGGDEFTIILEGLDAPETAIRIALRVQRLLNEPYQLGSRYCDEVSVSVGVATSQGPYEMPEEMVHAADRAMYRAKQNGRGEWIVLADEQRGIHAAAPEAVDDDAELLTIAL